ISEGLPTLGSITKKKLHQMQTKEDFFEQVVPEVDCSSSFLMLNFAYPMEPIKDPDLLDGILMRPTKEHTFEGLIGKKIGISLSHAIAQRCHHPIPVWCVNDVVTLLMSDMAMDSRVNPVDLAGAVVGTGVNMGMFLNDREI